MTDAERAHSILIGCLHQLRVAARTHAAEGDDLKSAGMLTVAAIQVAMATLLEAAEYLPPERYGEYIGALTQLRSEARHLLTQVHKLENP